MNKEHKAAGVCSETDPGLARWGLGQSPAPYKRTNQTWALPRQPRNNHGRNSFEQQTPTIIRLSLNVFQRDSFEEMGKVPNSCFKRIHPKCSQVRLFEGTFAIQSNIPLQVPGSQSFAVLKGIFHFHRSLPIQIWRTIWKVMANDYWSLKSK